MSLAAIDGMLEGAGFMGLATLNELVDIVSAQFFLICAKWKEFFAVDEIAFYC